MKPFSVLTLLGAIAVVGIASLAAMQYEALQRRNPDPTAQVQTPTRDDIQRAVVRLIQSGRASELFAFYAQDVGDPIRASLYIGAALQAHAPIHLAISVGWFESGNLVGTVSGPNRDGSMDIGPMRLNSITYRAYTLRQLEQIAFNIPQGVQHLVGERIKWGVSWETAMAAYNHGRPDGLDQRQIDYVTAVLRHEWELDRRFAARFPDAY